MPSTSVVRLTGAVLRTTNLKGTSKAGNAYDFWQGRILVGDEGVADVTFGRGIQEIPTKGEIVDYVAEVSLFGNDVQIQVVDLWPVEEPIKTAALSMPAPAGSGQKPA